MRSAIPWSCTAALWNPFFASLSRLPLHPVPIHGAPFISAHFFSTAFSPCFTIQSPIHLLFQAKQSSCGRLWTRRCPVPSPSHSSRAPSAGPRTTQPNCLKKRSILRPTPIFSSKNLLPRKTCCRIPPCRFKKLHGSWDTTTLTIFPMFLRRNLAYRQGHTGNRRRSYRKNGG